MCATQRVVGWEALAPVAQLVCVPRLAQGVGSPTRRVATQGVASREACPRVDVWRLPLEVGAAQEARVTGCASPTWNGVSWEALAKEDWGLWVRLGLVPRVAHRLRLITGGRCPAWSVASREALARLEVPVLIKVLVPRLAHRVVPPTGGIRRAQRVASRVTPALCEPAWPPLAGLADREAAATGCG
jgi:hypothetical protein